jgi:hypothetical protein
MIVLDRKLANPAAKLSTAPIKSPLENLKAAS